MKARLGVNIDHVATLRKARGEEYPCVTKAARICLENGADQITIHLREDRRHIQDDDLPRVLEVTKEFQRPLNLEMAADESMAQIALTHKPTWVCLVPEKRQEVTTEGGLNLLDEKLFDRVLKVTNKLKAQGIKVSLFLESNHSILKKAVVTQADAVEIHTGEFARDLLNAKNFEHHLKSYQESFAYLNSCHIACHAGHGLTDQGLSILLEQGVFEEYNVGHWIIAQAIFEGLGPVVKRLSNMMK